MTKVFFGGSRKVGRLNKEMKERADNIISSGYKILLGDANGADRAMQDYLFQKSYSNVEVFCAGNICRNNVGKWPVRAVEIKKSTRNFQYYAVRDSKMSEEADYGFMLWDGKSKGTLNNVLNLLELRKSALVYLTLNQKFFSLKNQTDLADLLSFCDQKNLDEIDGDIKLRARMASSAQFSLSLTDDFKIASESEAVYQGGTPKKRGNKRRPSSSH